jgi:hypothetical protein
MLKKKDCEKQARKSEIPAEPEAHRDMAAVIRAGKPESHSRRMGVWASTMISELAVEKLGVTRPVPVPRGDDEDSLRMDPKPVRDRYEDLVDLLHAYRVKHTVRGPVEGKRPPGGRSAAGTMMGRAAQCHRRPAAVGTENQLVGDRAARS